MTTFQNLRVEWTDAVATLTILRPHVCNALNRAATREIGEALSELADRPDVGAVIITGEGDGAFVAGADLREMREWGRDDGLAARTSRLLNTIERFPKPTIAAINGAAVGGGCELALACDVRIAAEHAMFAQPEVSLGVIPAAGATQRLPRVIGLGRATYMILTGGSIGSSTAFAWGLVSEVVPKTLLMSRAHALARQLIERGPLAIRLAKLALGASSRVDIDSGQLIETLAQTICFQSDDKVEGTTAFLEKRRPKFVR